MADGVREFDRTILIAGAAALLRPGVSNEIEQVLALEAEEGGSTRIIPVVLDDCLFSPNNSVSPYVLHSLRQRVIADFRRALTHAGDWESRVEDILRALRRR
jgi:uncharacterized secreted protein with C-terminal beta-propeller domain